jgi:hypothetical protein
MPNVRRRLFTATAWGLLAIALGPDLWKWFAHDADPRTSFGRWAVILHRDDEVVIRTSHGALWKFNYALVRYAGVVFFSCWLLSLIAAHLSEQGKERRNSCGLCRHCGYDLTGNTSGVCPECGTRTTTEVKA